MNSKLIAILLFVFLITPIAIAQENNSTNFTEPQSNCIKEDKEVALKRCEEQNSDLIGNTNTFDGCTVYSCQPRSTPIVASPALPVGCTEIKDESTGFVKYDCPTLTVTCPHLDAGNKQAMHDKCKELGVSLTVSKDSNGCEYYTCNAEPRGGNILTAYNACPSEQIIDESIRKCKEHGYEPYTEKVGGCLVAACKINKQEIIDVRGECNKYGGEYIEKKNENGIIVFSECIRKATKSDIKVRPVEEIPDSSDLLQLAFKLESLKIEFDGLSKKSKKLADYYTENDDPESAQRFTKVSSMFLSAKTEVDKIKTKIADKASGKITKKDLLEIRHDINYLKDVVMKNILFQMLGSDKKVEESERAIECEDEECFEEAISTCSKGTTVQPDNGFTMRIDGIEDDRCVITISRGSSSMTCRVSDYSLGIRDPETQILANCNGELKGSIQSERAVSTAAVQSAAMEVPGKCVGAEECRVYCSDQANMEECRKYLGGGIAIQSTVVLDSAKTGAVAQIR